MLLTTDPLHVWNGQRSSYPNVWSRQCHSTGVCEVTSENYYKILYLKVVNGFPYNMQVDSIEPNHNLDTLFNTALMRAWVRDDYDTPPHISFWDNCRSDTYFAPVTYANSYNQYHFKLQNGQEVSLRNLLHCVMITSGIESKVIYHNISDSWVDVALYFDDEYIGHAWRVHGNNPDPWDAPSWISNQFNEWPLTGSYNLRICYHLSSNSYGSIQDENINTVDDIYRTTVPNEIHPLPVKGIWAGFVYDINEYNEYVYDNVCCQFKKIRIEKYIDYHRFYVSYGDGAPEGLTGSGGILHTITQQNKWESQGFGITFDLMPDSTIYIIEQGGSYNFPVEWNEYIVYDTELEINKLSSRAIIPTNIFSLLTAAGLTELERIYNEVIADWLTQGWTLNDIGIRQQTSLVTKPRSI